MVRSVTLGQLLAQILQHWGDPIFFTLNWAVWGTHSPWHAWPARGWGTTRRWGWWHVHHGEHGRPNAFCPHADQPVGPYPLPSTDTRSCVQCPGPWEAPDSAGEPVGKQLKAVYSLRASSSWKPLVDHHQHLGPTGKSWWKPFGHFWWARSRNPVNAALSD